MVTPVPTSSTTRLPAVPLVLSLAVLASLASSSARAILPPPATGNLYVSSWGSDEIAVYAPGGGYLRSFSAEGLDGPRGIVVHRGESGLRIFVASQNSDEIFVFDEDERYLESFTHATLDGPTGMAISEAGLLYVGSFDKDLIVVFELTGRQLRSFTHPDLDGPNCVAFDGGGGIHVSSALTGTVLKFDREEEHLLTYTGGGLSSPMGIARGSDDVLYVAGGGSHNIVLFSSAGVYLGETWSHPDLTGPQGVAFDASGQLFSSSFYQDQLVELDATGAHMQTIDEGGLQVPRSIAFVPLPEPSTWLLELAALVCLASLARESRRPG